VIGNNRYLSESSIAQRKLMVECLILWDLAWYINYPNKILSPLIGAVSITVNLATSFMLITLGADWRVITPIQY